MTEILDEKLAYQLLPPRNKKSHKAMYGHVLIIGGGLGMPGAAILAATAAFRVGAGCVSIATRPEYAMQSAANLPEAMIHGITSANDLDALLSKATLCILGPGLGEDEWAQQLFSKTVSTSRPLVVDASALRLLAKAKIHQSNWILTPHPGEAAALLDCSQIDVQHDRHASLKRLQADYGGTVVLKGSGTLIIDEKHLVSECVAGNPGMATAGMGDVLSGVIGGLLAQGLAAQDAARLGVWLHATAGDLAAQQHGERGILSSDLMPFLHQLSNPMNRT